MTPTMRSLQELCEDPLWNNVCRGFETLDQGLATATAGCLSQNPPLAVSMGKCDPLLVLEVGPGSTGGRFYYYDQTTELLVGFVEFEDGVVYCPEGSARELESLTRAGQTGAADGIRCLPVCHVCGLFSEAERACAGPRFADQIEMCRQSGLAPPQCAQCACEHCHSWASTQVGGVAVFFDECVSEHCSPCEADSSVDGGAG
ncbi:MAG: hypothetical protein OEZ06_23065 [Myxococcales bacterium]|nr:hypothetical protein [Myxococcales bacterium]